jgi:hypothetical protein
MTNPRSTPPAKHSASIAQITTVGSVGYSFSAAMHRRVLQKPHHAQQSDCTVHAIKATIRSAAIDNFLNTCCTRAISLRRAISQTIPERLQTHRVLYRTPVRDETLIDHAWCGRDDSVKGSPRFVYEHSWHILLCGGCKDPDHDAVAVVSSGASAFSVTFVRGSRP